MSWLFSRALVEEYLEVTSLDGEPSAPLSGNPIPQAYCAPDRMTKFSRLSRFGMTFAPLTENRGEELLTLYLAGFPVKTSVPQDTVPVSPAVDQDSGLKWQGLLGKYDHGTHSWKTAQCSLLADLEQCLEIWPRWGLMQNGVSYQRQTLVRHTSENESGLLLPTPDTSNRDNKKVVFDKNATSQSGRSLATYARTFPTPTVMDATLSCKGKAGAKGKHSVQLSHLATSGALMTENHWETQDKLREMGMLSAAEKRQRFPTVTATANQLAPSMQSRYANPIWPSPKSRDWKDGRSAGTMNRNSPDLGKVVNQSEQTGALNPTWVEWLMGWPLGWTDSKPLEMDKFQQWQQQHSNF